jgi:hypothetical protein
LHPKRAPLALPQRHRPLRLAAPALLPTPPNQTYHRATLPTPTKPYQPYQTLPTLPNPYHPDRPGRCRCRSHYRDPIPVPWTPTASCLPSKLPLGWVLSKFSTSSSIPTRPLVSTQSLPSAQPRMFVLWLAPRCPAPADWPSLLYAAASATSTVPLTFYAGLPPTTNNMTTASPSTASPGCALKMATP